MEDPSPATSKTTKRMANFNQAAEEVKENNDKNGFNDRMTLMGELVYQRYQLEFKEKCKESKRDSVLEENLLDVKRLLKTSAFSAQQAKTENENGDASEKKTLVKVNVDPYYTMKGPDDTTVQFESRFESGNLAAALKVTHDDYLLLLQNDVNTSGHT